MALNGSALERIVEELRGDREVVLAAVRNDGPTAWTLKTPFGEKSFESTEGDVI